MSHTESYQKAWQTSLRLLAMREYGSVEISRKIQANHNLSSAESAQLITQLQTAGYLSDERFTIALIRSLITKGKGPVKILYELRNKGISDELAHHALAQVEAELAINWVALASEQRCRKFGIALPADFKERARQSRFLAGRGFNLDSINAVFHEKC